MSIIGTMREEVEKALWCAAKAAGGTLRIGGSVVREYKARSSPRLTIVYDEHFNEMVISAYEDTPLKKD